MVMALSATQKDDLKGIRIWLAATAIMGMVFIGFQIFEFWEFAHHGLLISTNLFGSTFFTLTGFHGAHVSLGIVWLWVLFILSFRGKVNLQL